MKISNKALINELQEGLEECVQSVKQLTQLDPEILMWKENPDSWNALECIEHLNMYGDFYIPEIRKRIQSVTPGNNPESLNFKYSWWGNYFANAVAPRPEAELNKMNAFKKLNPISKPLDISVLDKFLKQQDELKELLNQAEKIDLNKVRTDSTIPMVRLRLGDTIRVEILHNQRHVRQACRTVKRLKEYQLQVH
ncbi:DinB family protein [bacterium SCSIO 12643]|nr:DinB family protein [bacterium SCSIO 12643]